MENADHQHDVGYIISYALTNHRLHVIFMQFITLLNVLLRINYFIYGH